MKNHEVLHEMNQSLRRQAFQKHLMRFKGTSWHTSKCVSCPEQSSNVDQSRLLATKLFIRVQIGHLLFPSLVAFYMTHDARKFKSSGISMLEPH
jgi:hypothetical protein